MTLVSTVVGNHKKAGRVFNLINCLLAFNESLRPSSFAIEQNQQS